ncbi:MAG: alpha/beta fold hydrolase [Verrucomicrobiota bacterium]
MEKPVVFKSGGQQVVGMLHLPARREGRVPAVVFFHGFTGTKVEAHQLFVKTARALARAGIAALRFDFRGSGDSAGSFSTMTVSGELKDARAALRYLRGQRWVDPRRIGIVGMSMGGMIAAIVLAGDPAIRAAALWAPVAHPDLQVRRRMNHHARRQLKEMGVADYWGYAVGPAFVQEMLRCKPLRAIRWARTPVLLVHGSWDRTVPSRGSREYEAVLKKAGNLVARQVVRGADHTFSSLEWETQVIATTLAWFRCRLKGPTTRP